MSEQDQSNLFASLLGAVATKLCEGVLSYKADGREIYKALTDALAAGRKLENEECANRIDNYAIDIDAKTRRNKTMDSVVYGLHDLANEIRQRQEKG